MKAYVFDLDGTLLNHQKQVGSDTRQELLRRTAAGDLLILATSRPIRVVRHFIDPILLQQSIVITLNGAVHHDTHGNAYQHSYLGKPGRSAIKAALKYDHTHFSVEIQGEAFATNVAYSDAELFTVHRATRDMIIPLNQLAHHTVSKIAVDGLTTDLTPLMHTIAGMGLAVIPCLEGTFLNVVAPGMDKSTTLRMVLDEHRVSRENVLVFGDDIPDIEMMKMAGISVAMGNAIPEVKAVADIIIGDCDEDGIGIFLRRISSESGL
jgi:Cof subfamily protein (haloacid dehalogenase superfamily)